VEGGNCGPGGRGAQGAVPSTHHYDTTLIRLVNEHKAQSWTTGRTGTLSGNEVHVMPTPFPPP
jgi:hypothetical protein